MRIALCLLLLLSGFFPVWKAEAQQTVTQEQCRQAENLLTQVYQQLMEKLSPAEKQILKQSEIQWIKNKQSAIDANPQNANAVQYLGVMDRVRYLSGILNGSGVQKNQPNQKPQVSEPQSSKAGIISQRPDRIEGINSGKEKWAYEFLDNISSGNPSILDNTLGQIVFQNTEWIVTKFEEMGNVGRVKTDIFFYDSRTLKLIASARIPNSVIKVGIVDIFFYVLTITPGKYCYDDSPLVICLVDPKNKEIDRLKLVEDDYWFALHNHITVKSKARMIQIGYDPTAKPSSKWESGYLTSIPQNPHFSEIRLLYQPESKTTLNFDQMDFNNQASNGLASLQSVGVNISNKNENANKIKENASLAFIRNGSINGSHLIKSLPNGFIEDIYLDALKASSLKVSDREPESPGMFSNGTLRCIVDQKLLIFKNPEFVKIAIPKYNTSFDSEYAYISEKTCFSNSIGIIFSRIDAYGNKQVVDVPNIKSDPEISGINVFFDQGTAFTHQNDGTMANVFKRYSLIDGNQLGRKIVTETGKSGYAFSIKDGKAPTGWWIMSAVTDYSTLGAGYSIIAQKDDGLTELRFPGVMSELADPLEMRTNKDSIFQILQSCAGITKYSEYTVSTNGSVIAEWKSPPQEGKPLLLSEKNLIFIPKPSGYEAYHVFGEGKPERAFEIYFRGTDYVILLPNGVYAGSPGCERLITLQAGDGKVDASALAPWRNRPAEVIKALGGDPKTADVLAKMTDRWLMRMKFDATQPEPKSSEIPKVEVNQMPPLWAKGAGVSFPIEVTAGAAPLKEVTVRVNGIPQLTISAADLNIPSGGKGTVQGSVTLAQGQNWIEVTATDEKGRVSNQAHFRSILPEAPEKPKRYIVAMGCSEYDRPELNLQYAAKDAGDVLKTFQEAGGSECKTLLLTNKEVGPEALEKIKAFVGESKESDEVILFCAGHGLLDEHLDYVYAGHQIDPEHPGDTGIHLDALLDAIKAGKSLKRLVLMDTCQSGSVGEKEEMKLASASTELPHGVRAVKSRALKVVGVSPLTGDEQQRFIEEMFLLPGQHRGINIIGASGGAEYAMESDKWNNGVFTSALIEALHDKKADMDHRGRISVSDLKTYLGQRVPELTGGAQKPSVVAFEQDQDFDLVGNMPPVPESVQKKTGNSENGSSSTGISTTDISNPSSDSSVGASTGVLELEDALAKADAGDPYAQGVVSIYYTIGYKVAKDTAKGLAYAMKSASQKNPLGIYQVGILRELGAGMKKSKKEGRILMSNAFDGLNAMNGDPYALYDLGMMALEGVGVDQNPKEAARLFKVSADMGYAPAQRMYAKFLEAGVGVPKDLEAARQYQSQSSAQWSQQ